MEYKIDEIFKVDDVKLKCIKRPKNSLTGCSDCYFFFDRIQCNKQLCLKYDRKDKNYVIFKEIKD